MDDMGDFVVRHFIWGLSLGYVLYLMAYFWGHAVSWLAEAFTGKLRE